MFWAEIAQINTPDVKTCPDFLALFKLSDEVAELGGTGEDNPPCHRSGAAVIRPRSVFCGGGAFTDSLPVPASVGSLDFVLVLLVQHNHCALSSRTGASAPGSAARICALTIWSKKIVF